MPRVVERSGSASMGSEGMVQRWFGLMLVLLGISCVPASGRLEANRFQHQRYPYAVFYSDTQHRDAPFGPHWRIDRGAERPEPTTSKAGGRYALNRVYDLNGDGRGDFERLEQRYDLLLENTQQDATLWLATFPIAERDASTNLSGLARRYAEAMAAQGELVPNFGPEMSAAPTGNDARTELVSERSCALSKRESLRVDVTFTRGSDQRAAALVFVRTGYIERVFDGANGHGKYPVIMVIGNMAHADKRAALEPDFQSLLDHTVLGDQGLGLSMNGENTCGSAHIEESAGAEQKPVTSPAEQPSPEQLLAPMPSDSPAQPQ
jgi:hypothetical protein